MFLSLWSIKRKIIDCTHLPTPPHPAPLQVLLQRKIWSLVAYLDFVVLFCCCSVFLRKVLLRDLFGRSLENELNSTTEHIRLNQIFLFHYVRSNASCILSESVVSSQWIHSTTRRTCWPRLSVHNNQCKWRHTGQLELLPTGWTVHLKNCAS